MDFLDELDKEFSDFFKDFKIQFKDEAAQKRYIESNKRRKEFFLSSDFFNEMYATFEHTIEISEKYRNNCKKIFRDIDNTTVRVQRAVGGNITTGYYYPCPIEDIVTGGAHRGKIQRRGRKNSIVSHVYGFDNQNRLATVKMIYCNNYFSFLKYNNNTVAEYIFEDTGISGAVLTGVTETLYDKQGRILSLIENLDLDDTAKLCTGITKKNYLYDENGLKTVICKELTICRNSPNIPGYVEYYFLHNEEGCLNGYQINRPYEEKRNNHIFPIPKCKQRKV